MKTFNRYLLGGILLALCGLLFTTPNAQAQTTMEEVFPATPDPLVGDYVGRWNDKEDVTPEISAQVIALGRDKYRIRLQAKLDMRCPPTLDVEVKAEDGKLSFEDGSLSGVCDGTTFKGERRGGRLLYEMQKVERSSPTLGAKPPAGAIVLFDGNNLDAWNGTEGWQLLEGGVLLATPDSKYIETKQKFKDVKLHIEFRTPFMPSSRGQQRGNSGVFFQDEYEVQVLDSYGLEGYYDECGALYKTAAPKVNACLPPLSWQTYDITYHATPVDENGNATGNPRITVLHNGNIIHNDQEIWWITGWKEVDRKKPHVTAPGSIKMQGHGNFVQYRNIWAQEITQ